jgi:phage/plasmid-associated DNA primase
MDAVDAEKTNPATMPTPASATPLRKNILRMSSRRAPRGLVEWRKHGLTEPEEVKAATAAYRADEDLIVRFMNEEASVGNDEAAARDVYNRYKDWVRDNHEGELSERKFAEAMKEHGYTKVRRETGVFYKGFKLQPKQVWTPQTTATASGDEEL